MKIDRSLYCSLKPLDNPKTDLFPRCQHPDTRTAKEFFQILRIKQRKRILSGNPNWGPARAIICNETGLIYESVSDAARKIGINKGSIAGYLAGRHKTCKLGLTFKYL